MASNCSSAAPSLPKSTSWSKQGRSWARSMQLPSRRSYLRRRKVDRRLTRNTISLLLESAALSFEPGPGEAAANEFVRTLYGLAPSECGTPELHLPSKTSVPSGWARNRRDSRPNLASHAHVSHAWAGGWRCWLCPAWSRRPLKGRCGGAGAAPTPDVSLSFFGDRLPVFRPDRRLEEGSDDSWPTDWEPTNRDSDQLSHSLDVVGPSYRFMGRMTDGVAVGGQTGPLPASVPSPTSCQTGSGTQPPAPSSSALGGHMLHSPTKRLPLASTQDSSSSTSTATQVARHSVNSSASTDHFHSPSEYALVPASIAISSTRAHTGRTPRAGSG
jgi:hypothetical protein